MPEGSLYLDRASRRYIGGILVMLNELQTHCALDSRRMKPNTARSAYSRNPTRNPTLERFMGAMTGLSRINFEVFAANLNFPTLNTL